MWVMDRSTSELGRAFELRGAWRMPNRLPEHAVKPAGTWVVDVDGTRLFLTGEEFAADFLPVFEPPAEAVA